MNYIETQILLTTLLDPLCSLPYMGRDVVIENDINEYMYMLTVYKLVMGIDEIFIIDNQTPATN